MPRRPRLLPLAVLAALSLAAPAHADPFTASADDPADGTRGPSSDLEQVRTTVDPDAGSWTITYRFYAPVSDTEWAMANASLASGTDGCAAPGPSIGYLRASTKPSSTTVFGTAGSDTGAQPWTTVAKTVSTDGREVTLTASSDHLQGRTPACAIVTLSYNSTIVDRLDPGLAFAAPAPAAGGDPAPAPGAAPGGTGAGAEPGAPPPASTPPPAPALRLAAGSSTLRVGRDGVLRVALRAVAEDLGGTARLHTARGVTLGWARWSATAGRPIALRVRLTAAGRRYVRKHHRPPAELTVTARRAAGTLVRTFRVRLSTN